MIKKWNSFLSESNVTIPIYEDRLKNYFNIESEDIKSWVQDFLDEYNLDFDVIVRTSQIIDIYFINGGSLNSTAPSFPIDMRGTFESNFLESRLAEYDLFLRKIKGEKITYSINYICISFIKSHQD